VVSVRLVHVDRTSLWIEGVRISLGLYFTHIGNFAFVNE
jgi:hypothetical protein